MLDLLAVSRILSANFRDIGAAMGTFQDGIRQRTPLRTVSTWLQIVAARGASSAVAERLPITHQLNVAFAAPGTI
jgi:hypothetical protein